MANPEGGIPPAEYRFVPGQSGNPGGKTSEQKQREMRNAEMATLLQARQLEAELAKMAADPAYVPPIEPAMNALVKNAQDRGLGAPTQTVDATMRGPRIIELTGPDGDD